jgi:hypothetical protein
MSFTPSGVLVCATGRLDDPPRLLRSLDGRAVCSFELSSEPSHPGDRPLTIRALVPGTHAADIADNPAYDVYLSLPGDALVSVCGVQRDRDRPLQGCSLRGPRVEVSEVRIHGPRTRVIVASPCS